MPDTFSQIYLQFVFAVNFRQSLISKEHKEELQKYIRGLVQHRKAKMLAVNCMPDHIHIFTGFKPVMSISDFVKEVKVESNEFINNKGFTNEKFSWQQGYGVFSYSHSHVGNVVNYVMNQEEYHKKKTFKEEYYEFLKKFEIPFEEKYLFDFVE